MENEVWKDIVGYEGLYQISNLGRIKSLEKNKIDSRGRIYKRKDFKTKENKQILYNCFIQK